MEKAVLYKVEPGQWNTWKEWCTEINTTLREEAILTLEEEQVLHELALGFSLGDDQYVIGFMQGECLPANTAHEINQKHRNMREQCLEKIDYAETLYNIQR